VDAPSWLAGLFPASPSTEPFVRLSQSLNLLMPAAALAGLADRYRRASPTVRQQVKWLLLAAVINVGYQLAVASLGAVAVRLPTVLMLVVAPLPTLGAALAIFRYRLWAVDQLISRTIAFAALWALGTALLMVVALVAGISVGGLDRKLVVALALAILVALAIQPLRSRLEAAITRLIYGDHPRGYAALATLRDAVESRAPVAELASTVADVARAALGASWAAVWLQVESEGRTLLRLAGWAGDESTLSRLAAAKTLLHPGRETWNAEEFAAELPEPVFAAVPLVAAEESIGIIACGGRAEGKPSKDDQEILGLVARQSALLLRNVRLERELRERLEELRESRQRLVSAQDGERRRLERDLHDGVQQQLVILAAKL
jgi:signal transduction histidine kinase